MLKIWRKYEKDKCLLRLPVVMVTANGQQADRDW
jgi:hypothetical protein